MEIYDPLIPPDPDAWLAIDRATRIALIEDQVTEGDAIPVREKLRQLMAQGLDRHEAIHAIGSVLIKDLAAVTQGKTTTDDPNIPYFRALKRLNAKKWPRSG
nr:hypothetical protein [uncultured Rhodopila sp.]